MIKTIIEHYENCDAAKVSMVQVFDLNLNWVFLCI